MREADLEQTAKVRDRASLRQTERVRRGISPGRLASRSETTRYSNALLVQPLFQAGVAVSVAV